MELIPQEDCKNTEIVTSIQDRLTQRKARFERDLADVNAALEALRKNPEVAEVLTLCGRVFGRSL